MPRDDGPPRDSKTRGNAPGHARPIRVLIVDDHPVVCRGLAAIIQSEEGMEVVGQAYDGGQAVKLHREHRPDVTLVDLRLPVKSGVEVITEVRAANPDAVFVVLTTYRGDEDIHRALKAGAKSYLLKGMSDAELVESIRRTHAGQSCLPPQVKESLANRPPESELKRRELEILELIVKGMSNQQIADALGLTHATVKWYVNIVLSRLNVTDRTQAAVAALQRGIVVF